jgi:hypothetical protein
VNLRAAEGVVNAPPPLDRPPLVQEDLYRPPHRHPADDGQALAAELQQPAAGEAVDRARAEQARDQKGEADEQALAPQLEQPPQLAPGEAGLVVEIVVDGLGDQGLRVDGEGAMPLPYRNSPTCRLDANQMPLRPVL